MQIVYISNRHGVLNDTLTHVRAYMPLISDFVVVAPASLRGKFIGPLTFIDEREVLGRDYQQFERLEHQSKNYLLRSKLAAHPAIADEFLMSDDDARPLCNLEISVFKSGNKYQPYYFYDLRRWEYGFNDFDMGQQNTGVILSQMTLPTRSYASHMPQVVNKDMLLEASEHFAAYSTRYALCEWSTYFNYCIHHFPERFHGPAPFATLAWPENPQAWPLEVAPIRYLFENYADGLYRTGGVFAGLETQFDPDRQDQINLEKIIRWRRFQILCSRPELNIPHDQEGRFPAYPGSKLKYWILRAARKFYRHLVS